MSTRTSFVFHSVISASRISHTWNKSTNVSTPKTEWSIRLSSHQKKTRIAIRQYWKSGRPQKDFQSFKSAGIQRQEHKKVFKRWIARWYTHSLCEENRRVSSQGICQQASQFLDGWLPAYDGYYHWLSLLFLLPRDGGVSWRGVCYQHVEIPLLYHLS